MGPEPPDSCGEEEPWTRFDHPGPVALDYLNRWCEAVQMQADRAVGTLGGVSRWVDAALLVMALNEARRAAELARAAVVSDPKAVTAIREAVRQFDDAMPGVRRARDMIEHFDACERGTGDTQQPGVKRPKREANKALAQAFRLSLSDGTGTGSASEPTSSTWRPPVTAPSS